MMPKMMSIFKYACYCFLLYDLYQGPEKLPFLENDYSCCCKDNSIVEQPLPGIGLIDGGGNFQPNFILKHIEYFCIKGWRKYSNRVGIFW